MQFHNLFEKKEIDYRRKILENFHTRKTQKQNNDINKNKANNQKSNNVLINTNNENSCVIKIILNE